jgi:hypothetical protein
LEERTHARLVRTDAKGKCFCTTEKTIMHDGENNYGAWRKYFCTTNKIFVLQKKSGKLRLGFQEVSHHFELGNPARHITKS